MPLSSGYEYVVLRYGKPYMKYVSQMFLNYCFVETMMNMCTLVCWLCADLCVYHIYIYIIQHLYIYMPAVSHNIPNYPI